MAKIPSRITEDYRLRYLGCLALSFFIINLAVRLALQFFFPSMLPVSFSMLPGLLKGLVNDFATLVFVMLLPAALILLPREKFMRRAVGRIYAMLVMFVFFLVFIFGAFAEYFFWEEFGSRFNFIAVDYLIYTTELMENMVESYPLFWLLSAVFVLALGATIICWKKIRKFALAILAGSVTRPFATRLKMTAGLCGLAVAMFFLFNPLGVGQNRYWNEYARNGVYEMFSAYLNNELDYRAFYKTMDSRAAFELMRGSITDASRSYAPAEGESLLRMTEAGQPEKRPNVVLVIMESMGSKWLGEFTPNLTGLSKEGLAFSNMMSTGTRTVRGIEALMLSVPPTPGNSIVRRPDNDNLFSLGSLFRQRGYDLDFVYSGIGYFDNMNAFFRGNGYAVTDKLDFNAENKTFSNAWGQCDEDLYAESLRLADRSYQAGKPFKQVLLTTSNHRPYTFPEGKISMEQGSRQAAINYADYAIGEFLQQAKSKPWFDNTVFVFVGDHPSSIAGKTEVPADAYGIVCVLYGPKFFEPQKVETLCSQIDVAPTLLASLGWEYPSQFFGTNALQLPEENGRAWISTYQLLGFRTNSQMVILRPDGSAQTGQVGTLPGVDALGQPLGPDELVAKAVASYQCAYDLFSSKRMKESMVTAFKPLPLGRQHAVSSENERSKPEGNAEIIRESMNKPAVSTEVIRESMNRAGESVLGYMLLVAGAVRG